MKTRIIAAIALSIALTCAASAQVPQIINYQGRVTTGGTNFNGTGQFKFALVNNGGSTTYWSNGVSAVSLTVTKGLYSVLLGDTTIANMSFAIPYYAFTNSDVRLRVWFDDGVNGIQQLSPDQRIGAVGYALAVANVHVVGDNTFIGDNAGNFTMNGLANTAIGIYALTANTSGSENTAVGRYALGLNTNGFANTAVGNVALFNNTSGYQNTAVGDFALYLNTTGIDNTAIGAVALNVNSSGNYNTASGAGALNVNSTGSSNTANGAAALTFNTTGYQNTANGVSALYRNTTGFDNTANGVSALFSNTTGFLNTADGCLSLYNNTTGSNNVAIGNRAGYNLTTGSHNIDIGNSGVAAEASTIRIGTGQTATYIAGISGVTISPAGAAVFVNSSGQLGTVNSSQRFKEAIRDMGSQSDVLLSLRPVAFRYKHDIDAQGLSQFGLIAEEVAKVAPELVLRDAKDAIYTVRYEQINAMLLNEFLKQHHQVQDQQRVIGEQQKQIQVLNERLTAVATKMQQVSEQVEQLKASPLQAANVREHGGL